MDRGGALGTSFLVGGSGGGPADGALDRGIFGGSGGAAIVEGGTEYIGPVSRLLGGG